MAEDELRLADLLAALSVTTDLAMGQPPEKAMRACVVATEIARRLGLPESDVTDVYYTTLLKHLGCTATGHEEFHLFGPDDLGMRPVAERTDIADRREMLGLMWVTGQGAGLGRLRYLARAMTAGKETNASIFRAICEVAARMAERLDLGDDVRSAVLKVAHHGSDTGTTETFVDAVRPAVAVISVGALNPFGHPDPDTLAVLEERGASVYRTDEHGAVIIQTDGRRVRVRTFRH